MAIAALLMIGDDAPSVRTVLFGHNYKPHERYTARPINLPDNETANPFIYTKYLYAGHPSFRFGPNVVGWGWHVAWLCLNLLMVLWAGATLCLARRAYANRVAQVYANGASEWQRFYADRRPALYRAVCRLPPSQQQLHFMLFGFIATQGAGPLGTDPTEGECSSRRTDAANCGAASSAGSLSAAASDGNGECCSTLSAKGTDSRDHSSARCPSAADGSSVPSPPPSPADAPTNAPAGAAANAPTDASADAAAFVHGDSPADGEQQGAGVRRQLTLPAEGKGPEISVSSERLSSRGSGGPFRSPRLSELSHAIDSTIATRPVGSASLKSWLTSSRLRALGAPASSERDLLLRSGPFSFDSMHIRRLLEMSLSVYSFLVSWQIL